MKQLIGLRVNLFNAIDIESGAEELNWQIVLVLGSTQYEQNGDDINNIAPKLKTKAVRFRTNLKGLENLKEFVDALINDTHKLKKETVTP